MAFLITAAIAACERPHRSDDGRWSSSLILAVLALFLVVMIAGSGIAKAQATAEYQIKAAYIYNFGKFVEWPRDALSTPSTPFRICILGDSPFDAAVERALTARKVQGHPVGVFYPDSVVQSRKCHVLFLSQSESGQMRAILADLGSYPVLTIADTSGFISAGGMINFIVRNDSVRFEINSLPASQAGLKISSKLLVLGTPFK